MTQILVIDDDATMRMVVTLVLRKQGYRILQAKNGEEGILMAQQHKPALIICDWMMPKVDGLQVCQTIKSDPHLASTFFILLTAREEVRDRIQGLDTGADEFLSKPIEATELQSRVRAGLRLYNSNQALKILAEDLRTQKQRLEEELAEAASYVQSLLPVSNLQGVVPVDSYFLPSKQLGGDFFYHDWIDDRYLRFYFLDVSGHGIRAALLSVSIRNFLQLTSLTQRKIDLKDPGKILSLLNENFSMENHNGQYFTIVYGIYDRLDRQLTYANGGHPPGVLLSQPIPNSPCCFTLLEATGIPIGFLPGFDFQVQTIEVPDRSTLYLFSDGIYEIIDEQTKKPWGFAEFSKLLTDHCYGQYQAMDQLCQSNDSLFGLESLVQKVKDITQSNLFEDDCSVLKIFLA